MSQQVQCPPLATQRPAEPMLDTPVLVLEYVPEVDTVLDVTVPAALRLPHN